jgi:hypothetical protein
LWLFQKDRPGSTNLSGVIEPCFKQGAEHANLFSKELNPSGGKILANEF